MRLASRFFRRQTVCLAPPTAAELLERGLEAARDAIEVVAEAASEAVEASPRGSRGRTAVTVAAVTATALVATAAYVWWKRRDHVAVVDTAAGPAPITAAAAWAAPAPTAAPAAEPVVAEPLVAEVPPVAPEPFVEAAPVEPTQALETPLLAAEPVPAPVAQPIDAVQTAPMHLADDCGEARRAIPQPSVASTTSTYSRPPAVSGRFAMPGVRGVVLPGGGGSLP